ncbi:hypothetical protein [Neolewinella persica]|uniref:hypothetical protein n=1 Tax=Neolewinella persica TaxID=70998 RepID=UPI0004763114|nr:hypothetical protein [Neolewinella persica]
MMIRLRSILPLLVLITASLGLKGQRPTEFDLFREAMIVPIKTIVIEHIDSLTANQAKYNREEAHFKRLVGSSMLQNYDWQAAHEDLVRQACPPDSLGVALAVLRKMKFYDNRISQWGRAAKAGKALSDIPLLRRIYDQHSDEWIRRRANESWLTSLLQPELVRRQLLFHLRTDNYSGLYVRGDIISRPSRTDLLFWNRKRDGSRPIEHYIKISSEQSRKADGGTATAGGSIPDADIFTSYPQNGQFAFYAREQRTHEGFLLFKHYQGGLRSPANDGRLWMKWKNQTGEVVYTDVAAESGDLLQYGIPVTFLEENKVYEMSLVDIDPNALANELNFYAKKSVADIISKNVRHREVKGREPAEQLFFRAYFRTSSFSSFYVKIIAAQLEAGEDNNTVIIRGSEGFAAEDQNGLNGMLALCSIRPNASSKAEGVLSTALGRDVQQFLHHPNLEYVAYLEANRGSLNIDSLVAIEFLPYAERAKKYRKLNYKNEKGARRSAYSNSSLKMPAVPRENFSFDYGDDQPQRITEADFLAKTPPVVPPLIGTYRYIFQDQANLVLEEVRGMVAARIPAYAEVLQRLNALAPQAGQTGNFTAVVSQIAPSNIQKLETLKIPGLEDVKKIDVNVSYSLPGRTRMTTSYRFKWEE